MAVCSCGAEFIWMTLNGSRIPVNPIPVKGGNLSVCTLDGKTVEVVKPDPNVARYVTHFADCPDAAKHRKRGAA